jgi:Tol biopolymer transport system component
VSDRSNTQEPDSLYLVSVQTGEKKRITFPKSSEVGDYYPAFSPDGRSLAFARVFNQRVSSDIYVQPLRGGKARRITFDSKIITGLTWASQERLVFTSDRLGNPQIWNVSSGGGSPELVLGTGQGVSHPTASADGHTLVYAEWFRNADVWRVPLGARPLEPATKLIASSTSSNSAQYSPDGKRIVFFSDRLGIPALWICQADGSHPTLLLTGNGAPVGTPRAGHPTANRLSSIPSRKDTRSLN